MRNPLFATWLLRRLLPSAHADAILGDLLETSGGEQDAFRKLLRETVWSLGWRNLAGYFAAATIGGGMMVFLQTQFSASQATHEWSVWQRCWGSTLAFLVGCMAMMTCFSAIRYGVRDRMTWLALACTAAGAGAVSFWWVSAAPVAASICMLALAAFSVRQKSDRRALLALVTLTVLQPVLWFGGLTVLVTPVAAVWKQTHSLTMLPLVVMWLIASYLVLTMAACATYAKARHWAVA